LDYDGSYRRFICHCDSARGPGRVALSSHYTNTKESMPSLYIYQRESLGDSQKGWPVMEKMVLCIMLLALVVTILFSIKKDRPDKSDDDDDVPPIC
jgi:hypothetical protein